MTQFTQSLALKLQRVPQVSIYGIPVSKLSLQDTVRYLTEVLEQNKGENQAPFHVVTANPIMIMTALSNDTHMTMMKNAELIVPDGTGLVWATYYVGNPVVERVPGIDLLHELMKVSEQNQWSVFLLGTSSDTIRKTAGHLNKQYPRLILAGYRDGYFQPAQDQEVIAQIREAKPHILLVGRSENSQDVWIDKYKYQLNVPLMMGIGGSFDVIAGTVKRAPRLWQKLHMEWLYRLLKEPRRFRRMLLLPKFALKVILEKNRVQQ